MYTQITNSDMVDDQRYVTFNKTAAEDARNRIQSKIETGWQGGGGTAAADGGGGAAAAAGNCSSYGSASAGVAVNVLAKTSHSAAFNVVGVESASSKLVTDAAALDKIILSMFSEDIEAIIGGAVATPKERLRAGKKVAYFVRKTFEMFLQGTAKPEEAFKDGGSFMYYPCTLWHGGAGSSTGKAWRPAGLSQWNSETQKLYKGVLRRLWSAMQWPNRGGGGGGGSSSSTSVVPSLADLKVVVRALAEVLQEDGLPLVSGGPLPEALARSFAHAFAMAPGVVYCIGVWLARATARLRLHITLTGSCPAFVAYLRSGRSASSAGGRTGGQHPDFDAVGGLCSELAVVCDTLVAAIDVDGDGFGPTVGFECHSNHHRTGSFAPVLKLLAQKGVSSFAASKGLVDEGTEWHDGGLLVRSVNHIKVVVHRQAGGGGGEGGGGDGIAGSGVTTTLFAKAYIGIGGAH